MEGQYLSLPMSRLTSIPGLFICFFATKILHISLCITQSHAAAPGAPCTICKHTYSCLCHIGDASFTYFISVRNRKSFSTKSEYSFLDYITVPFYFQEHTLCHQQFYQNHQCPLCKTIQLLILIYFLEHLSLNHYSTMLGFLFLFSSLLTHSALSFILQSSQLLQ